MPRSSPQTHCTLCVWLCGRSGRRANTRVRRQETLVVPTLYCSVWKRSLTITHSSLLADAHSSLSLSLFISAGSRTVALHSTLINNLYRKTTKRVNWQTPHALTVRLSFSWFFFFFFISFFFTLACFSINDSRVILITARDWLNLNRTEDASVNCQSQRRSRLYMYRTRRTEWN